MKLLQNAGRCADSVQSVVHTAVNGATDELHGHVILHPSVVHIRHPVHGRRWGSRAGDRTVAPVREIVIADITESTWISIHRYT